MNQTRIQVEVATRHARGATDAPCWSQSAHSLKNRHAMHEVQGLATSDARVLTWLQGMQVLEY